jgi:hypothetical protein
VIVVGDLLDWNKLGVEMPPGLYDFSGMGGEYVCFKCGGEELYVRVTPKETLTQGNQHQCDYNRQKYEKERRNSPDGGEMRRAKRLSLNLSGMNFFQYLEWTQEELHFLRKMSKSWAKKRDE